jgi:hypothetical protein
VQFFPLLANCTRPCAGLYLYLRVIVPVRVRHCTSVYVLARVQDCTCSYARLYLLVCVTVLVLARVFNCTRVLCVTVPARVCGCICTYSCARLYLLVCAIVFVLARMFNCTRVLYINVLVCYTYLYSQHFIVLYSYFR